MDSLKDNSDVLSDIDLDTDDLSILRRGLRYKRKRATSTPGNSNGNVTGVNLALPLSVDEVGKLDQELQLNLDNLIATAPMRENQARRDAVGTASRFFRSAFDRIAKAYINLAARSEEIDTIGAALIKSVDGFRKIHVKENVGLGDVREIVKQELDMMMTQKLDEMYKCKVEARKSLNADVEKAVAGGMDRVVTQVKSALVVPRDGATSTYASVSAQGGISGNNVTSVCVLKNREVPIGDVIEFVVEPSKEANEKFRTSDEVKKARIAAIDPVKFNMRVSHLFSLKVKAVRVVATTVNLEKLRTSVELKKAGLVVRDKPKLNPRLIIRGVPSDMRAESMPESIVAANLTGSKPEDIKIIYVYPKRRDYDRTSVAIKTTARIRSELLKLDRVYIGYAACRIEDHVRVINIQCFKCLRFNHLAKECKELNDVCGHCMGGHETRSCSCTQKLCCRNCHDAKLTDTQHSAMDAGKCTVLAHVARGSALPTPEREPMTNNICHHVGRGRRSRDNQVNATLPVDEASDSAVNTNINTTNNERGGVSMPTHSGNSNCNFYFELNTISSSVTDDRGACTVSESGQDVSTERGGMNGGRCHGLAVEEAAAQQHLKRINEYLHAKVVFDPPRTHDAIKSLRKRPRYKQLVEEMKQLRAERNVVMGAEHNDDGIVPDDEPVGENEVAVADEESIRDYLRSELIYLGSVECGELGRDHLSVAIRSILNGNSPEQGLLMWFSVRSEAFAPSTHVRRRAGVNSNM
ncbi:hypothetical protein PV325_011630, partial [Microctonus aethiopoides]